MSQEPKLIGSGTTAVTPRSRRNPQELTPLYSYTLSAPGAPQQEEEQVDSGLIEYWRILKRRKGTVALVGALGILAAVVITLPQTPVYQSKTTLEVLEMNQNFMNFKDVQQVAEATGYNMLMDIQTQMRILQSETIVERVVDALGLVDRERALRQGTSSWSDTFRSMLNLPKQKEELRREEVVRMAQENLRVKAAGQTRIIEVYSENTDPKLAADVANRLVNEFIEQNVEARWKATQKTGEFLNRQLEDMRARLEQSEDALQNYLRRSGLMMTGEKNNVSEEKLLLIQDSLTKAQSDLVAKQSRYEMAKSAAPETLPDVLNDSVLRDYETKLAELKRQEADLAESFTPDHPRVKKVAAQLVALERRYNDTRNAIVVRIRNEYEEAARKQRLLEMDYRAQSSVVADQGEKSVQYNILKREVDSNRTMYEAMLQRVKESRIASAMKASNVRVVDPAKPARRPARPILWVNMLLGLLGGTLAGIALVVATERADRTLQEPADLQNYLGIPELGVVPAFDAVADSNMGKKKIGWAKRELPMPVNDDAGAVAVAKELPERLELITMQKKAGLMAESFRAVLTSLFFAGTSGERPRFFVVTSANPGEGKSTVTANLAIAAAEAGQRILLIDADMRKPRMHDIFGISNKTGLSTLLQRSTSDGFGTKLEDFADLMQATPIPGLSLIPAGPLVAGPTNLLYAKNFGEHLERFQEWFDMVIVDTPPMLQIPDARVIGKMADGVVLVVRAGKTTRDAAQAVRTRLTEDGIPVLGTVMNDWNPGRSPSGYYGSYGGYHKYYKKYGYTQQA